MSGSLDLFQAVVTGDLMAGLALVDRGRFGIAKIFDGQGATIVERATDGRDFYRPRYAGRRRARFKAVFQPADS